MLALLNYIERAFTQTDRVTSTWFLQSLARFTFAAALLVYYWKSALTKIGDGFLAPSVGAYVQIFPKAMEAAGYNPSELTPIHTLVVLVGTYSEFAIPFLIVAGFLTRLAALGMIGFIAVQSLVDIFGHDLGPNDIGSWFDSMPDSLILDQRAFWIFLLLVIALKGAGPVSVDRLLFRTK